MSRSQPVRVARRALLALALLSAAAPVAAKRLPGVFTTVTGGETLVLDYGDGTYDVRILGIDAPEPGQPFADEALAFLREQAQGRDGAIRFRARNAEGEMVSRVYVAEVDLGLEMVRRGLAWRLPSAKYKPLAKGLVDPLTAAEQEARVQRRGLWSQAQPVAPWTSRGAAPELVSEPYGELLGTQGLVDRNTSQKTGADSECAIAKNPANPQQLFISCNTSSAGLFAARSTDGGVTWIYPDATDKTIADGDAGQGTSACCDPSVAWDSFGNLFISYISAALNSIVTILSTDGGATFSPLATFSGSVDQNTTVVADVAGGSAVWTVWNNSGSMAARGALATGLGTIGAFSATQTAPTTSGCNFGDIVIAPSGVVTQICEVPSGGQGPATLRINIDADGLGANNFGAAINTITTNVGGFDFIPAQNSRSVDAEAGFTYDRDPNSPHFGRLYLVYTEEPTPENHDLDILVRFSDDNGATWSAPQEVNDDATTRSQFLPKITWDAATGKLAVCWHDARNSGTNTAAEMVCAGGNDLLGTALAFSPNVIVSDGSSTSNGSGVEFGDYMGITSGAGFAHPVWGDTSNSTGDNPNTTSSFDAYTDFIDLGLFFDGFESNDDARWSSVTP